MSARVCVCIMYDYIKVLFIGSPINALQWHGQQYDYRQLLAITIKNNNNKLNTAWGSYIQGYKKYIEECNFQSRSYNSWSSGCDSESAVWERVWRFIWYLLSRLQILQLTTTNTTQKNTTDADPATSDSAVTMTTGMLSVGTLDKMSSLSSLLCGTNPPLFVGKGAK